MTEINSVTCGDCLEIMPSIPDKSIDMINCDLPYGITACKWDTIIPFELLWVQYKRIIKDNGAIVLSASQPFTSKLVMSNLDWFKYEWIWRKTKKTGFQNIKKQPMREHENVLVFYKNHPSSYKNSNLKLRDIPYKSGRKNKSGRHFNCLEGDTEHLNLYEGYNYSILEFNSPHNPPHPTQKPVALYEYLIKTYTNEGDIVLDNCAGSGTTAIACINLNRNYILIEQEQKYIDIINQRIKEATRQMRIF